MQTWRRGRSLQTRTDGIQVSDAFSSDSLFNYLQEGMDACFYGRFRPKSPGRRLKTKIVSMATPIYTRTEEIEQGKTVTVRDVDTVFSERVESLP
ncbi:MAG: hypothetical protein ABI538_05505 [Pseudoxanthomonas sp.]